MIVFLAMLAARAQSVAEDVTAARDAIIRDDYDAARTALDAAEDRAPSENAPIQAPVLANIPYLRGIVLVRQGDPDGDAIDRWRATLAIQNDLPWDTGLVPNGEERALFEALRKEVEDRARSTSARRPRPASHGSTSTGVACAQATPRSRDDTSPRSPVPTARRAAAGPTSTNRSNGSSCALAASTRPSSPRARRRAATTSDSCPCGTMSPPRKRRRAAPTETVARLDRGGPSRTVLLASGGALVAVGLALDLLWVAPTYAKVSDAQSDPESVTRAEANELTASYNAARWTTIGVLGAGIAIAGSSFFVHPAGAGLAIDGTW